MRKIIFIQFNTNRTAVSDYPRLLCFIESFTHGKIQILLTCRANVS